ncbi:MAG: hypothetical protein JWM56_1306 [Candidatus Peribacteria bacterium]|nr:hypothetical protein [Candidatus Peribacteria bacterium]
MNLTYASPGTRLLARLLDGLVYAVAGIFLAFLLAKFSTPAAARATATAASPMLTSVGMAIVLCVLIIVIYQVYLLSSAGQTLGKKWMNIKIVREDTGLNGGFYTNVFLRAIVNGLLSVIPFYKLVDMLCIFREDHRCIHDMIAGTVVVNVASAGQLLPAAA